MLLRIQPDESLRSYVERNLFLQLNNTDLDILKEPGLRYFHWTSWQAAFIANVMGWHGCYGFNKLVHLHSDFPFRSVFKSRGNLSYSGSEFIQRSYCFDSLADTRAYCPSCVNEDMRLLGYSYWRRIHPHVTVCAKHNVSLLSYCQFCAQPFSRDGHAVQVMWGGCAGHNLGEAEPTANKDPLALRLAQFFERVCSLKYHVAAETALDVLVNKLKDTGSDIFARGLRQDIEQLIAKVGLGKRPFFEFFDTEGRRYEMLELLAVVYDGFDDFLGDCLRLEPSPVPINSYWNTYQVYSGGHEHYVEEDYRLGVSSWICSDVIGYLGNPHRDRRPRMYPCCNLPHPRRKGHQLKPELVKASLPKVRRLGATGWAPVTTSGSPQGYQSSIDGARDRLLQ
jgi:hypothetical protein